MRKSRPYYTLLDRIKSDPMSLWRVQYGSYDRADCGFERDAMRQADKNYPASHRGVYKIIKTSDAKQATVDFAVNAENCKLTAKPVPSKPKG